MIIPIFAIFCAVGLPVVAIIVLIVRLTSSTKKERMAMIQRGMIPPERIETAPSRLKTLRAGMGAVGTGVGAVVGLLLIEYQFNQVNELYQMMIVLSSVLFFFGIAYIIYFVISKDKIDSEE